MLITLLGFPVVLLLPYLGTRWFMAWAFESLVLKVRKIQAPVQKLLWENTKMIWGCQCVGQIWRIQLIPAFSGPGQHAHGLACNL